MIANNYILLLKILLKWSLKSKEYEMTLFIYSNFKIGIPVKFLYNIEYNNVYSLNSFLNDSKIVNDIVLQNLFDMFKRSKYKSLNDWNNMYGYVYE